MEVSEGPNWGCSAKGKKMVKVLRNGSGPVLHKHNLLYVPSYSDLDLLPVFGKAQKR
jgi:hypothetical protein